MATQYFWRHPFAEQVREEGRVEGRKEGREAALRKGRLQGRAEMVVLILLLRGIQVSDDVRAQVHACSDLDVLAAWASRALRAERAEDLFSAPLLTAPPRPQ
ncbi:hypothetical protein [Streptomyces sp. NPDC059894]|uniref:hypothetical protein n=1 Tax=unclassified Streptomyces TaxID=2593676 RepID=UPI003659937C